MSILNMEHIRKIYGDRYIFEDVSFGIQEGDKIGIVGINGTGKTTLLAMAAGMETPDAGRVVRQNNIRISVLPQNPEFPPGATVSSYAFSGDADRDWKVGSNLNRLGITELDASMETLSGGQRRKTALAKLLAEDCDLLLLDEPTNHLDKEMILWLEEYLKSFRGTLLMVTHDRYFLDQVTNRILEISHGKIYGYEANYSRFLELKAQREEQELSTERKRQSILRMELEWAARGCRARSTKQRARLERLEALKALKAPVKAMDVELDSRDVRMGKKTIELCQVSKNFGDKVILKDVSYIVLKGQRLGIIGPNGCGKSTLLKLIAGLLEPDEGEILIGETIRMGYFAQEEQDMDENIRVIDYVKEIAEYIATRDGRISASQMLERFLFTPDMQYAPIGKLSGGEKRRLYLLGILAREINVLVLDEPGNALDIPTMTILEDYLNSFAGIVITVSHDRYFLDNVVDRILAFDGHGGLEQYEGGYTDYLEALRRKQPQTEEAKPSAGRKETAVWEKGERKLKFSWQEAKDFQVIEDEIATLEDKLEELEQEIAANASSYTRLTELSASKEEVQALLDAKMERWMYLTELNERIQAQK